VSLYVEQKRKRAAVMFLNGSAWLVIPCECGTSVFGSLPALACSTYTRRAALFMAMMYAMRKAPTTKMMRAEDVVNYDFHFS